MAGMSGFEAATKRGGGVRQAVGSVRSVALPLLLFFLIAAWPILHVQIPPLGDYVNHLARMYVIADAGRDAQLARFYAVRWKLIPNLAMDLVVPPLAGAVGIYWAGKVFVLFAFALILTGAQAVHRALFQRFGPGPLAAALFLYTEFTSLGLLNYIFGIGVALWGLACWIALRGSHPAARAGVSLLFVAVLFLCHFSALGLYGTSLAAYEAWVAWSSRPGRRHLLAGAASLLGPFVVVPFLLAAGPRPAAMLGGIEWRLWPKVQGVLFLAKTYYHWYDVFTGLAIAACVAIAWQQRRLRLHPAGWFLLAVAAAVYLALPYAAMSAFHVDDRYLVGAVLMLCGFLRWTSVRQGAFLAALAGLLLLRVGGVELASERLNTIVAAVQRSLALVKPGSKILVAYSGKDIPMYDTLDELPCLAIIERSSLVSNAFADPTQQVLEVKQPYRAFAGGFGSPPSINDVLRPEDAAPPDGRVYWRHWMRDYDYLYVVTAGDPPNPVPGRLMRLDAGPHFQLYRIDRAPAP